MNILIINLHSTRNKGDAGIVLSMIDALREAIPDCQIRIKSRHPDLDRDVFDVPVHECIENIRLDRPLTNKEKLKQIWHFLKRLRTRNMDPSGDYEWADVVVSCGGGFILSHKISIATLQHLLQMKVAFDYGKPVVIYSQSIGPFYNKFMSFITGRVLKGVVRTFVREEISREWLKRMGITSRVEVVPDAAFAMQTYPSPSMDELIDGIRQSHPDQPLIGVTVRDWHFPEKKDLDYHREKYIESVRKTIKYLETAIRAKVLLMPQTLGPNAFNDDRKISLEIIEKGGIQHAELIDRDLSARELKYLYSKLDMFIGTRMHSNIFALGSLVPTVAINYEHKTKGIMEMVGLPEYVVDIGDITPEQLMELVQKCWDEREQIRTMLADRIPEVVEQAKLPALFIRSLGKQSSHHTA